MTDIKTRGVKRLAIERLIPHPDNPRKDLGDISELTESIRTHGVFQNLTVTPAELVDGVEIPDDEKQYYVVVIGHRRLAAAKAAGLTDLPCMDVSMDRKEQLSTMLLENIQRSDLTAYEQAWGFEQMSLLGCSVEEISEKSGFSKSTVRRRLKMAELDHATLQEVSTGRQLSLSDFDQLAEIEDIDLRNEVLKDIGTRDFGESLAKAKIKQAVARRMPEVKKWLKEHHAKKITAMESWGNKYETFTGKTGRYYSHIRIDMLGEDGNKLPSDEEIGETKLFYVLDDKSLRLCKERTKAPRVQKTQEQKDQERARREAKKEIKELSALHYGLRKAFVEGLTVTSKNENDILMGAYFLGLYLTHSGANYDHSDAVTERLGLERYSYYTDEIVQGIGKVKIKDMAMAIYAMHNDKPDNWFAAGMETTWSYPSFQKQHNTKLTLLYYWLISLGYEPSTDELALMDGSHELYHRGDKANGS